MVAGFYILNITNLFRLAVVRYNQQVYQLSLPHKPYPLRRIIALFCLALLLFTNTELYQLVKMPVLLEHYQEHKAGGMSLLGFLKEHYFNGGTRNPDYERDMQLPFKTPTHIASLAFVLAVPHQPEVALEPLSEQNDIVYTTYSDWLPATYLQKIFQPPRA